MKFKYNKIIKYSFTLIILIIFIFGIYYIFDQDNSKKTNEINYQKEGFDYFYQNFTNSLENFKDNLSYVEFDLETVSYFDNNFKVLNTEWLDREYDITINDVKQNKKLLWIGFGWFYVMPPPKYFKTFIPIKDIMLINLSNLSNYSTIHLNKLEFPNSFCFQNNYTYFTTKENGFEFGVGRVNQNNYSDLSEKLYTEYEDVIDTKILCNNNSVYVITEKQMFKLNKETLELNKFLTIPNSSFYNFKLYNNKMFIVGYNTEIKDSDLYIYNFENKSFEKSFYPKDLDLLDLVIDNKTNMIYLTDDKKLYKYSLNGTFIEEIPNFNHFYITKFENYITKLEGYYNTKTEKMINDENYIFYMPRAFIKFEN